MNPRLKRALSSGRLELQRDLGRLAAGERDLSHFDPGSLAFLASADELAAETDRVSVHASMFAALAHHAAAEQHREPIRPVLGSALKRWMVG